MGPTVVGYGIEGAMKFGVYEVMKPLMANLLKDSTAVAYIAASVFAGAVAAILLCPMESTRIRVVTDKEYAGKGLLSALPKLIREEGLLSTFSGIWAMLAKQVCTVCMNLLESIQNIPVKLLSMVDLLVTYDVLPQNISLL